MNLRNMLRTVAFVAAVKFSLFATPVPAAMLSPGDILVADSEGGIFNVDPSTGDRTVISGFGVVGSGSSFNPGLFTGNFWLI